MKKRNLILALVICSIVGAIGVFYFKGQNYVYKIDLEQELDSNTEYVIRYWDYPLFIAKDNSYEEFLIAAIKEFQSKNPNIKVKYKLLPFNDGEKKLNRSLKAGNSPDVYHDIFGQGVIDQQLQIAVSNVIKKGEYNPLALKNYYWQEEIMAFPNWIIPNLWAINKELFTAAKIDLKKITAGWSWEQYFQVVNKLADNSDSYVIFNQDSKKIKEHLKDYPKEDFFADLNALNLLPAGDYSKQMLAYFNKEKASMIGPINLWLYNYLLDNFDNDKLFFIPPPTDLIKKIPLETSALVLFQQENSKGEKHTRAVYEFIDFMREERLLFICKKLGVPPAYNKLKTPWKEESNLRPELKRALLKYIIQGDIVGKDS